MKQIFIVGAYGQNNLGDDALLQVFTQQFSDSQIVVNSARPADTEKRFGVKTVKTYVGVPRFSRLRALMASDLLVFGGGSLLKEIEGSTWTRMMYFMRILLLLLFAKLIGRPTAMLAVGIGPLHGSVYKMLTRVCANMTDLICVRDTASRDLLRAVGVKREVIVTADAVFALSFKTRAQNPRAPQPYAVVVPRYSLTEKQQTEMARACDALMQAGCARIIFLPFQHQYLDKFDDTAAARNIRAQMQYAAQSEIIETDDVQTAYAWIGDAALVVSARLHALIFGAMQGVPGVALNYEPKIHGFMQESGQENASVELADVNAGKLVERVTTAWQTRATEAVTVQTRAEALRHEAQRNFDLAREVLAKPRGASLLRGTAIFFISATIVNAGNYLFNLILGRWLGPAAFADISLMVTLMLLVSFITAAFSLVGAKFVAMYSALQNVIQVASFRRWLGRIAWGLGIALLLGLTLGAPSLQIFFHTASWLPFILLGIGMPVYLAQAVDRGVAQGQTRFGLLALSYQAEMWARLVFAVILVALGFGVNGAVAALTISFFATWLVARRVRVGLPKPSGLAQNEKNAALAFALPASAALIGQILINNSDVLIVKHFFENSQAGLYAALALIGRIVFFATWSVVMTLFPIVAQKQERGEAHHHLLGVSLGLVAAVSIFITAFAYFFGEFVVMVLFGAAYLQIASYLWIYALVTALYALANVVINYRLSAGSNLGSWFAVVAGFAQVVGLWVWHADLLQVVLVQLIIMAMLFGACMVWDLWLTFRKRGLPVAPAKSGI